MSRPRLREALRRRQAAEPSPAGPGAVVPRVGAHAARLEQVGQTTVAVDAEALARALRNAQALYGYDAVTLGACGTLVAADCHLAVGSAAAPAAALRMAAQPRPMPRRPEPAEVVDGPCLQVLRGALERLRPVLGDRAGTAVVLPTPARLAEQTGFDPAWAAAVLMEAVRSFGAGEPDLFLAVGPGDCGPLATMAEFFGAGWVGVDTPGVVTVPSVAVAGGTLTGVMSGWLFTTDDEIPADADPRMVAEALTRLGARSKAAGGAVQAGRDQ